MKNANEGCHALTFALAILVAIHELVLVSEDELHGATLKKFCKSGS